MNPPTSVPASRREDVVDLYHGIAVPDPYRWLEAGDDPEVVAWVAAQNAATRSVLDADPARAVWHRQLVELLQLPVVVGVERRGDRLFSWERPAAAEQLVLARRSAADPAAAPVVLIDPATHSADAATAIDWFSPSDDGALIAVGLSEGGTENSTLTIVSGDDGSLVGAPGDTIPNTRAASVAWEPDASGFFYTRYPDGDQYHRAVHHHRLGTDWRDDPVVWQHATEATAWPSVVVSPDGSLALVTVSIGWARTDVHLLNRASGVWTPIISGPDAITELRFTAGGDALVGTTTLGAGRGRVVRVGLDAGVLAAGPDAWETLVAERDDVISACAPTADGLLLATEAAASHSLWRLDPDGRFLDSAPVDLGAPITLGAVETSVRHADAFAVVMSFTGPPSLWHVAADGAVAPWAVATADSLPPLAVDVTSYPSLDGTEIGLFVVRRADVTPGPDTPTILNGYGGFNISMGPEWRPRIGAWCAAGGVYVVAGLRGGAEHGEPWHEAGSRANKQNVFDDFAAAADFLVATGRASREHLAILGGSNGGLLVGAALTQRPDLCAAVVCQVPLLDMIRFPQFLIAKLWTSEYGDPDVAEEFAWVHAYSPYHHVTAGTEYPAVLLETAEGDSRVDPLHARKMAALLQWAAADQATRPILLFQEGRAGHGVGKPATKVADTAADELVFLGSHTGLAPVE